MVTRILSRVFFGAAVVFLALLAVLAGYALTGNLYDCAEGGRICREGIGALYIGLILLTASAASFTIGAWIRSAG
ncbi:hypothetical protein roselon_01457 [Roseibacterium elongatum DSM 19469]|uniref:Uncharacterized protein n=1 Tax=Roseicyclus elongatus DSM 19469 TaxID=1294273 RepID=W8SMT3_9RHOB|nr:hypothetical protein [Roseibacterium elongatum]AHM03840.1 hypothetical protein roselon_01457 [Roseibacterium elongatum DSM 19469]